MTDVLERTRALRPEVPELSDRQRRALRAAIFDASLEQAPTPHAQPPAAQQQRPDLQAAERRGLALAAASVLVLLGSVGIWAVSGTRSTSSPSDALGPVVTERAPVSLDLLPVPVFDLDTLSSLPVDVPITDAPLVVVGTSVGRIAVFDDPDRDRVWHVVDGDEELTAGWFEGDTVRQGFALSIGGGSGVPRYAYGFAPDIADFAVSVGERVIVPEPTGLWFVELTPDDLEIVLATPSGLHTIALDDDPAPTTTTVPATGFTPLVLADPGLDLLAAGYEGDVGLARYGAPDGSVELQVLNRARSDGVTRMLELGRAPIEIDGLVVYPDGEGDGACVPDVCSVGLQWDEWTYTSVMWVHVTGGQLPADATIDSLVALVPTLVADPDVWSPTTFEP